VDVVDVALMAGSEGIWPTTDFSVIVLIFNSLRLVLYALAIQNIKTLFPI
jgi:hypothetical protein